MNASCVTQPYLHVLLLIAVSLHQACLFNTSDDDMYDRHELALNALPVMASSITGCDVEHQPENRASLWSAACPDLPV